MVDHGHLTIIFTWETFHEIRLNCPFLRPTLLLTMFTYVDSEHRPGPKVIKLFSCSTQLRLKFILLINVKMPSIVGILTFISRINDWP